MAPASRACGPTMTRARRLAATSAGPIRPLPMRELQRASMAPHPKDDGRPAPSDHGGAGTKRNDHCAIAVERPTIPGEEGVAEHSRKDPEIDAGDHVRESDESFEPRVSLGVADRVGRSRILQSVWRTRVKRINQNLGVFGRAKY